MYILLFLDEGKNEHDDVHIRAHLEVKKPVERNKNSDPGKIRTPNLPRRFLPPKSDALNH